MSSNNFILTPEPGIYSGALSISVTKPSDVTEFAVTSDGIPPVLAKYIAYDNLSPANPFIAAVEDGLGKVLLDGGFPKWYNGNCNTGWTLYSQMSASYKYLYDALNYISNPTKVAAGNKKVLVIGDAEESEYYSIKSTSAANGGFNTSILKVCDLAGYQPTFKTRSNYSGVLDCTYSELDQYCCVLFFSTVYTSAKYISDVAIQSLISYRENGNGIFIITDHGDNIANLYDATNTTYSGFFRAANYLVTNFGCYFTGNYDRSPVNVGYLRSTYGNHPLWVNLADSEYIYAGGSESKVVVTEFPMLTGNTTINLSANGYIPIKILSRKADGSILSYTYTYGKNVPEVIFFKGKDNIDFTSASLNTFIRKQLVNIRINFASNASGLIKLNTVPIGTFTYVASTGVITKNFYAGYTSNISITKDDILYIQMLTPMTYTKSFTWHFLTPSFGARANKVINFINNYEFKNSVSTSKFRNLVKMLNDKNVPTGHFDKRFKYRNILNYFTTLPIEPPLLNGKEFKLIESLIYDNTSTIQTELVNRKPQTQLDIFNSWGRFDGEAYYDNKAVASGNSLAWTYNSSTNAVEMPLNVEPTNGFVSNIEYSNYEFSCTVTSTNADDDSIGIVAAFNREGSNNYYITFTATMGGFDPQPQTGIGVWFNYIRSAQNYSIWQGSIATASNTIGGSGWSGRYVRLKIKRVNDILYFWHSQTNSETLSIDPQFTLDLNSDSNLARFKGKKKYGYMTLSEPLASYRNIEFTGGVNGNILIDGVNNTSYEYNTSSASWVQTQISLTTRYGLGAIIFNPEITAAADMKLFKATTGGMVVLGTYVNLTSTTGINFTKSLVYLNDIGTFVAPTSLVIKKIWVEYDTDIQKTAVYSKDFTIVGNHIRFINPTTFNLNNAIILTANNEMYKLTEYSDEYIIDSVKSFKYINLN